MATTQTDWGPIGELVHPGAAGPDDPVYRDNAYLSFWSLSGPAPIYGEAHVSTSPNSDGRRARFTVWRDGHVVEIQEPLEPGSFTSDSIDFDPRGKVTVDGPGISATIDYTLRHCVGDYTTNAVLGTVKDSTLQHYQQGVDVVATITMNGTTTETVCRGMRDRTFGYRDEPKQWIEGVGFCVTTDDFYFTAIRNVTDDGNAVTDGFILSDDGALRLTDLTFTFDPIMLLKADLTFEDGSERTITQVSRQYCPIWFPQGPSRTAPAMTTWSEYDNFDAWGSPGEGIVGHWVRRII
ncbi:hypothetical protein NWT09_12215 [Mycolicibacterium sp. jd]|uniref:hypothetical protein n=1 Tax=unclassified Mycolicibacterium TaxID=2636767 RepID=UPI00351B63BA